jgi:hypothetical protein
VIIALRGVLGAGALARAGRRGRGDRRLAQHRLIQDLLSRSGSPRRLLLVAGSGTSPDGGVIARAAVPMIGGVIARAARRLQERLLTASLTHDEVVLVLERTGGGATRPGWTGGCAPSTPCGGMTRFSRLSSRRSPSVTEVALPSLLRTGC